MPKQSWEADFDIWKCLMIIFDRIRKKEKERLLARCLVHPLLLRDVDLYIFQSFRPEGYFHIPNLLLLVLFRATNVKAILPSWLIILALGPATTNPIIALWDESVLFLPNLHISLRDELVLVDATYLGLF
jgi:hypothetical protein